ncbi:MAG: hypothetical protein WC827_00025 [Candidatus Paceibacterota bacterium]|jgi:hypothetical protein
MLSIQTQPKYIEKEMQLPNGKWVLVVFQLVEINGKTIAKAVSGRIIEKTITLEKEEILAFPIYKSPEEFVPFQYSIFNILYSVPRDLSFIVTQPARAPNL